MNIKNISKIALLTFLTIYVHHNALKIGFLYVSQIYMRRIFMLFNDFIKQSCHFYLHSIFWSIHFHGKEELMLQAVQINKICNHICEIESKCISMIQRSACWPLFSK